MKRPSRSTRTEDTYTIPDACGSKATFTVVRYEHPPLDWLIEELRQENTDEHHTT